LLLDGSLPCRSTRTSAGRWRRFLGRAANRVERACIVLAYLDNPSAYAVSRRIGVSQQAVTRCLERAAELGVLAALDDRGRDATRRSRRKRGLGLRHGTVTLMAGIDLLTGQVHALVRDRHRNREFIEFLNTLDAAYPAATAIKVILDNHSAHVSRETKAWLTARPEGRFQFVFTPKHGSWLNLVEGFFAKAARSVLRHIRVNSKHELKQRITEFINDLNRDPVVHRWHYQIDLAA
jgi:transposase